MNSYLRFLALLCSILVPAALAEDPVVNPYGRNVASLGGNPDDYRLGGGDLIEISVYGVQSYKHTVRVAASGLIRLPLIGEVLVDGKTATELEDELEDRLRAGLIQNPTVSVFTIEYKSRLVFVLGSVRQPGQYQIIKQLRVIDVLTMAGGLGPKAGDELLIQRKPKDPDAGPAALRPLIKRIDLKKLLAEGRADLNVPIEDGDVITVPEKIVEYYYVVGEVNQAGAFAISDETPILASQALARAGGPMKTAKMSKGILVRYSEGQEKQQIPLDFNDIFGGEAGDFTLQPNDIIFLPGSKIKTFGYAMLQVLPATLARAIIWY